MICPRCGHPLAPAAGPDPAAPPISRRSSVAADPPAAGAPFPDDRPLTEDELAHAERRLTYLLQAIGPREALSLAEILGRVPWPSGEVSTYLLVLIQAGQVETASPVLFRLRHTETFSQEDWAAVHAATRSALLAALRAAARPGDQIYQGGDRG